MIRVLMFLVALAFAIAAPACAEVRSVSAQGFTIETVVTTKADPATAWRLFFEPQEWWSGVHSYSQDARNLRMEAKPGGCFCERLPRGGGVKHGEIVLLIPDRTVRLSAALGPLQQMGVSAAWTVQVADVPGGGAKVTWTYAVSGSDPAGGWTDLSRAVDSVLLEQANRFAAFADRSAK
jgi:hypothetical protein